MTAKRFTVPKNYRCIQDNLTKEHYLCEDKTEAINLAYLLNELAEENEKLKQRNQKLFDDLQNKTTWLSLRGGELAILKRENEQLKTTIQQLRTDNTKQKKLLNTTMKENEQLKHQIGTYKSGNALLKKTLDKEWK